MLHDLGERFNSPFVNLYLTPKDFIRYLKRIEHYQHQPITFPKEIQRHYPVGLLDDITLHFMHYHSEQEAVKKWQERTARLNLDNLFIIMTDRDGCHYEDLVEFDNLPFKHKVVFTHKAYHELKSTFYIQGFEHQQQVGDLFEFSGWNGKKYYDQFDYVGWFNQR
ncbi:exopolysaccharide biosynthesis protein [Actinobacillus indolicus]|nr:exopolysaccharide biosynthesis protein [Actinobacillus indolicus]VTU06596.1 exopolysaccharide biosynthesis protein [Actinobacillus indolicus]